MISEKKEWKKPGELRPLFDRLEDDDLTEGLESPVAKMYDVDQMRQSILAEVFDLLDTRLAFNRQDYEDAAFYEKEVFGLTVGYPFFYGVSDFSFYDPSNEEGREALEKEITTAIEIFEPRLKNIRFKIKSFLPHLQELASVLEADIVVGNMVHPISFPIHVDQGNLKKPLTPDERKEKQQKKKTS